MTQSSWARNLSSTVASQVRYFRNRRGWSAQQLADACTVLGYPLTRSALANLESGRRPTIAVAELLILARALNVPPVLLVFPVGRLDTVEPAPGTEAPAWDAAKWFGGAAPFPAAPQQTIDRPPATDVLTLFRRHDRYIDEWAFATRKARGARSMRDEAATPEERAWRDETAETAGRAARIAEEIIAETRQEMRRLDLMPPPLPAGLRHLDAHLLPDENVTPARNDH
ncbi:helix-turn-helix transcriptional regulator [Actinomadura sp. NPDC047616]|uniref:helix-turn-helix transcriptional regulator n=1 Tax=Actinomadura sp. NPDC047616 TaxID=3155914 RepID=UPI00340D3ACA